MKKGIIAIMVILCLGLMGFVGFMKFSEDNTPPEIQFQDNEIVYTAGDSYDGLLDGVTATDNKDGDVTESLVVESVYPNETDRLLRLYMLQETPATMWEKQIK